MTQLNQLNAIVESVKKQTAEKIGEIYKTIQKPSLFYGQTRNYTPIRGDDPTTPEGEMLPPEAQVVQADGKALLQTFIREQAHLLDVVYMRDRGNTIAKADVQVGDVTLFKDAPVPFLLWLEHRLDDLYTEVKKLPVLDPSERWTFDPGQNCYKTEPFDQARTRKIPRPLVLHPGNAQHPPQVKEVTEDVRVGTYHTTKFSTAFQAKERDEMLARIEAVQRGVKFAREKANEVQVVKADGIGDALYKFLFPVLAK